MSTEGLMVNLELGEKGRVWVALASQGKYDPKKCYGEGEKTLRNHAALGRGTGWGRSFSTHRVLPARRGPHPSRKQEGWRPQALSSCRA